MRGASANMRVCMCRQTPLADVRCKRVMSSLWQKCRLFPQTQQSRHGSELRACYMYTGKKDVLK